MNGCRSRYRENRIRLTASPPSPIIKEDHVGKGGGLAILGFWISVWSGVVAVICGAVVTADDYPLPTAERVFVAVVALFLVAQIAAILLAILGSLIRKPRRYDLLVQVLVAVFALTVVFLFILKRVGIV